jgi:hypothetical protein
MISLLLLAAGTDPHRAIDFHVACTPVQVLILRILSDSLTVVALLSSLLRRFEKSGFRGIVRWRFDLKLYADRGSSLFLARD